ncbi:hypothetical protein FRC07_003939 [Ceratobasidium sp. 392]|nr:hypothetical protein FRC07_003939 [Ceratobasidium sp. 392]
MSGLERSAEHGNSPPKKSRRKGGKGEHDEDDEIEEGQSLHVLSGQTLKSQQKTCKDAEDQSDWHVVGAGTSRRRGKARSQRLESGSQEAILSDEESSTPTKPPEETGSGSKSEDKIESSGEELPADPTTSVRSRPRRTAAAAATKPISVQLMEIELPPVASKSRSSTGCVTWQPLK